MTHDAVNTHIERQLARLREDFDSGFARPLRSFEDRVDQLVCFSAGSANFAMAMSGLDALVRCMGLTPIPARAPALLGLAVVRARIVPVYSLVRLTGIGTQTAECQWLVLLQGSERVALAADSLDGYALESTVQPATGSDVSPLVSGLLKHDGKTYATVRAAEIYNTIIRIAPENEKDT